MKKNLLQKNRKKTILTALALGLCLLTPWHRAEAVTSYTTPNGLFRLDYYGAGEKVTGKWYDEIMLEEDRVYLTSQGELPDWQKERLHFAADYWEGVLKHTKTAKQPAVLAVTVNHDYYKVRRALLLSARLCFHRMANRTVMICRCPRSVIWP